MKTIVEVLLAWNDLLGDGSSNLGINLRTVLRYRRGITSPTGNMAASIAKQIWLKIEKNPVLKQKVLEVVKDVPGVWDTQDQFISNCRNLADKNRKEGKVKNLPLNISAAEESNKHLTGQAGIPTDEFLNVLLLLATNVPNAAGQIRSFVSKDMTIPATLIYTSMEGTQRWIKLCSDATFSAYQHSTRLIAEKSEGIILACGDEFIECSPDYISLGPGNGQKDKMLLAELLLQVGKLGGTKKVHYFPYDVNLFMLAHAAQTIASEITLRSSVEVTGIVADFEDLPSFLKRFDIRPAPNLFLLLGNTLGNMKSEQEFMRQLDSVMEPRDRGIIEVRIITNPLEQGGSSTLRNSFSFTPLELLGVTLDEPLLRWQEDFVPGDVRGTRALVCKYGPYVPPWYSRNPNLRDEKITTTLGFIKHYEPSKFKDFLSRKFDILAEFVGDSTAIYVFKKNLGKKWI